LVERLTLVQALRQDESLSAVGALQCRRIGPELGNVHAADTADTKKISIYKFKKYYFNNISYVIGFRRTANN